MIGFAFAFGDQVDVEVDRFGDDDEVVDAGFFDRFAQGDGGEVGVAIAMAAGLQPTIELAVQREQGARSVAVQDQGGGGQVTGRALAQVGVARVLVHELQHASLGVRLVVVGGRVRFQNRARKTRVAVKGEVGVVGGEAALGQWHESLVQKGDAAG